jgi:hypothetical protein
MSSTLTIFFFHESEYHQKTNMMVYPLSIPPQLIFPHPLIDDEIHERGWQDIIRILGFSNQENWLKKPNWGGSKKTPYHFGQVNFNM